MGGAHADGKNYLNCDTSIWSWIYTLDHKRIALLYLFTISAFFAIGGVAALLVRTELASHGADFLTPQQYNVLFTLPSDTIVLTGHGPHTTVGQEIETNPFVGKPAGFVP